MRLSAPLQAAEASAGSNDCEYILDIAIRAIHSYVFCAVVSLISSPCSVIRKSFLFLGFDVGMREALP